MTLTRRRIFLAAAAGVLPRLGNSADLSKMIVRSSRPEDLEMPLAGFNQWITPIPEFFVRCHTYMPEPPSLSEWRLKLDGVVNQPLTLYARRSQKNAPRGNGGGGGMRRQRPQLLSAARIGNAVGVRRRGQRSLDAASVFAMFWKRPA